MVNSKLLFTTERLPEGFVVKKMFGLIQMTGTVEISKKADAKGSVDREKNDYQNILDNFRAAAPREANAVLGVQISTSAQSFSNGTFLFVTYIGTPAIIEQSATY